MLIEEKPEIVVVVGDVNSTMACTIAESKIVYPLPPDHAFSEGVKNNRPVVAHLEAGYRNGFD